MIWQSVAGLAVLFATAFGAATILPFQSEVVLAGLVWDETAPVWLIVLVATVGNTLGSMLNWWMGLYIEHFKGRRWFPASEAQLARAQGWWNRYGYWTLLLSWAPFGDATTLIAGIMRTPLWLFTVIVGAVKAARYVVVAWALI